MPLLEYLRQQNWIGRPAGHGEYVGLCPLHEESRPSFYVNTHKDVFYCHGCGQGGDLIRFLQLSHHLPFHEGLAYLDPPATREKDTIAVLEQAATFYQHQLDQYPEALGYLWRRGVYHPALIRELGIGYAPGGNLRRHLTAQGYSFELLRTVGLINAQGADALYQRIVFPLRQGEHIVNLYGRSIGSAFAHRFLPGCKGGLYAWEKVRHYDEVILVEGLFDYGSLRQAGFSQRDLLVGHPSECTLSFGNCVMASASSILPSMSMPTRADSRQQSDWPIALAHTASWPFASCCHRVTIPTRSSLGVGDAEQFRSLLEAAQP